MSYYEKRIADLEARVAQLAREQRLKAIPVEAKLLERYALMQAENSRLKAEVERLEKTEEYLQNTLNQYALDDMRLQAKNERLRKAGDAMALNLYIPIRHEIYSELLSEWNAAKEGKQS